MTPAQHPPVRPAISPEEINRLPLARCDGPVHLIVSDAQAEAAVERLRHEMVLGFDTESRAAFRKGESYPPCLVQLAAHQTVFLFRLNLLDSWGGLLGILSAGGIVKAGISLATDLAGLQGLRPFRPAGFVDLADLAAKAGVRHYGLRGLAAAVLGLRVSKGAQRSNWSRASLSAGQIAYAAMDAWACREIYLRLAGLPNK
jgi:ribonuclease D